MPLNRYQRIAADVYAGGEFSWVQSDDMGELNTTGDSLFNFIILELADPESAPEAIRRMMKAQDDIRPVIGGLALSI